MPSGYSCKNFKQNIKKIKSNKTFKKLYTIIKHSLLMGSKPVLTSENQLM